MTTLTTVALSIQRLYTAAKLTAAQVEDRVTKGTITEAEYEEIVGTTSTTSTTATTSTTTE